MGRHKTITDDAVLGVARAIFRDKGHTATTREIALAAGISEAILYQRFASKDDLFFAAMVPGAPDVETLLGPRDPPDDAHAYLRKVVGRLGEYFGEVIPLAVRVMTHPAFEPAIMARMRERRPAAVIQESLTQRLASLASRKRIVARSPAMTARLLVSLAHDWALGAVLAATAPGRRELKEMVDVVWEGLRPAQT
jgi:AcrR family transcriptional regulator